MQTVVQKNSQLPIHGLYRADIDGLRAFAVLLVIGFHAFPVYFPGGFVGVDVFFVISGFLISKIILTDLDTANFTFAGFYKRRARRIFPALTVVLLCTGIAGWFLLTPKEFTTLMKHIVGGTVFISNLVLWNESGYFDALSNFKPLLHLWSLGIEEQFYIFWPIVLVLCVVKQNRKLQIICATAALSFVLNLFFVEQNPTSVFYLPWFRIWELVAGCILSLYSNARFEIDSPSLDKYRNWIGTAGIAIILIAAFLFNHDMVYPGWRALLPVFGATAVLFSGSSTWIAKTLLTNRVSIWFGKISYPLYLWHWPILSYLYIFDGGYPPRHTRIAAVLLSILLAKLTYELLEKYARRSKSNISLTAIVASLSILLLLGLIGMSTTVLNKKQSALEISLDQNYDTGVIYRYHECFIDTHTQNETMFSPVCADNNFAKTRTRPNILIWGDSHAAHLYPGFKAAQATHDFLLAQYTATSCPPLIDGQTAGNGSCKDIITHVLRLIQDNKPDVVIMGSRWERDTVDLEKKLKTTFDFLKKSGVRKIVVYGPPPAWQPTLKTILLKKILLHSDISSRIEIPAASLSPVRDMDNRLRKISSDNGATYISLVNLLCNKDGCISSVGPIVPDDLITVDSDHFTKSASKYVVNQTFNAISDY